ncbi:MAG: 16S rRNA (adenine(1518)-N(6)/adenine(1519)-N(6))-dimethyltransferase RsmA [Bacteroidota bacterium]|nr:16S rRNA (adenine(1518)-N(6)/adenine(1519)-N(6))-dimethyltransferase RsmA [Bacteroidota bacterium]MDW8137941.1 16S rRNA (adenine(1518)-N(6)/adenine(1519)-N(6))-dimethyltransferase RsmA [Bacteroidota bacterium]
MKPELRPTWKPRKRWGQHFLRDLHAARHIAALTEAGPADWVIEIGPGTGSLTVWLLERTPHVTALEIDPQAVTQLRRRLPELDVRQADVRDLNWPALLEERPQRPILCGNLPYYLGSWIVRMALENRNRLRAAVFTLQREVAERLTASAGTKAYGSLSVLAQLWSRPELCLRLPPGAFYPPPKVESAVVRLVFDRPELPVRDAFVEQLVRAAFARRRKTLRNNLRSLPLPEKLLLRYGNRRAEELSPEVFVELAQAYEVASRQTGPSP